MSNLLSGRRLAILSDRKKPEHKRILQECRILGAYLADRNVEYWSGGTGTSKTEMQMMIEDYNKLNLRPTVCFPSLPVHAFSAMSADVLFRPYLNNTSGTRGFIANRLVSIGRGISHLIYLFGGYPEIEIRDTIYEILDGSTSVGKMTGAINIDDDSHAITLFQKELEKHPNAHGYLEGGSGTLNSPIHKRIELIEAVDSILPSDRILHIGGSITDTSEIDKMDDRITRKNVVYVVGNYFEQHPENIKEFASLFPK